MLRCPLSKKWSSRILSRTNPTSGRTPVFSQTQRGAIEAIVTDSVRSAITTLQTSPAVHLPSPAAHFPSASTQNLFTPGMASPLGFSRPVDKTKYSGVSTLTLRYFWPIHYTSPRSLNSAPFGWLVLRPHGFSGYHGQKEKKPALSRAALKHGIRNHGNGNRITETESNINDSKLKNFTLHNLVQSKENLFQFSWHSH